MNTESLIHSFKQEVKNSDQMSFPICVNSFANLWQYEFGSLDNLPQDIDDIIANKAIELGLVEEDY